MSFSATAHTKPRVRGLRPPAPPGARRDDPQVAVTRHCRRHFLLLSRSIFPCKLPLPTTSFSPGTKKNPVPPPPPPPPLPLSCQRSGLGLGNPREKGRAPGWGAPPPAPPSAPALCEVRYLNAPARCLGPGRSYEAGRAQLTTGAGAGWARPGSCPPPRPPPTPPLQKEVCGLSGDSETPERIPL